MPDENVVKSLAMLRKDAHDRGLLELAIVCGWSLMRFGNEKLEALAQKYRRVA